MRYCFRKHANHCWLWAHGFSQLLSQVSAVELDSDIGHEIGATFTTVNLSVQINLQPRTKANAPGVFADQRQYIEFGKAIDAPLTALAFILLLY